MWILHSHPIEPYTKTVWELRDGKKETLARRHAGDDGLDVWWDKARRCWYKYEPWLLACLLSQLCIWMSLCQPLSAEAEPLVSCALVTLLLLLKREQVPYHTVAFVSAPKPHKNMRGGWMDGYFKLYKGLWQWGLLAAQLHQILHGVLHPDGVGPVSWRAGPKRTGDGWGPQEVPRQSVTIEFLLDVCLA